MFLCVPDSDWLKISNKGFGAPRRGWDLLALHVPKLLVIYITNSSRDKQLFYSNLQRMHCILNIVLHCWHNMIKTNM